MMLLPTPLSQSKWQLWLWPVAKKKKKENKNKRSTAGATNRGDRWWSTARYAGGCVYVCMYACKCYPFWLGYAIGFPAAMFSPLIMNNFFRSLLLLQVVTAVAADFCWLLACLYSSHIAHGSTDSSHMLIYNTYIHIYMQPYAHVLAAGFAGLFPVLPHVAVDSLATSTTSTAAKQQWPQFNSQHISATWGSIGHKLAFE